MAGEEHVPGSGKWAEEEVVDFVRHKRRAVKNICETHFKKNASHTAENTSTHKGSQGTRSRNN